jgi:hypothetical protein
MVDGECRVTSVFVDDVELRFPPKFSAVLRRNSPRMSYTWH